MTPGRFNRNQTEFMGRVSNARERLIDAVAELIWTDHGARPPSIRSEEKAEVKKGSFYYFFESKADLAAVALDAEFKAKRAEMDAVFSPTVPPLDRIRNYCEFGYRMQTELKKKHGFVLGCPLFTLGAEVSTQEQKLRENIQEVLEQHERYFESAIRDAHAAGLIQAPDPAAKALG